jgi:PHD-finger
MKSEEGLGIEYDENVICDVCRSPDSEEANEMVFCDNCNICVHQACYGITTIPSGIAYTKIFTKHEIHFNIQYFQDNGYVERAAWAKSRTVCYVRIKVVQ